MDKRISMLFMVLGAILGGIIPASFSVGMFSWQGLLGTVLGAAAGIWLSFRISQ